MRRTHRKCINDYQHFFVQTKVETHHFEDEGLWDRTITLECSRCGYVLWVDSIIRPFLQIPRVWRGT